MARSNVNDPAATQNQRTVEAAPVNEPTARHYRKKPIVIEAIQWFKHGDHPAVEKDMRYVVDSNCGLIRTLEDSFDGAHHVSPGDWIIKGMKGEYYACKPDIFEATYEQQNDMRLRSAVRKFAEAMETRLRENDHKRHWRYADAQYLSMRLTQEREELRRACRHGDAAEILHEASDVANFSMMIADNAARQEEGK